MWQFDQHVTSGLANQGDIQNGKGDFFNDFVALLLETCSERHVDSRPNVAGLSFRNHKLDIAYPLTGSVRVIVETKASGTPKHLRNPRQANAAGRPGSADLEKRIKEAAFKNIDIKGEVARLEGKGGGATNDLRNWLRATPPKSYLLLSCRVVGEADLKHAESLTQSAEAWFEGCGIFAYGPNNAGTAYDSKRVHPGVELDRVLSEICTALRLLD